MTNSLDVEPRTSSATWLRIFALLYDPFLWLGEAVGMRRRRRALLEDAYGCVVEIGAGTGLNVGHYSTDVTDLILTEPEPGMLRRLAHSLQRAGPTARIVDARADRLPVSDASVDTVVSTLVLCTVDDPVAVLREIARVLRPGGQVLFIEHVRSNGRRLAAVQDALVGPWRAFAGGCVCNRRTVELLHANGFDVDTEERVWRGMPALVHPIVIGRATLA